MLKVARPLLLFLLVSICLYYNGLNAPYIHDDIHAVGDNPAIINGIGRIKSIFTDASTFSALEVLMYRPVTVASLALDSSIAGHMPETHRFVNVVIHALVCFILMVIMTRYIKFSRISAFAVCIFFATNPMNTMTVNYLSSRSTLLAAFFFLASLATYMEWRENRRGLHFVAISAVLYVASCLSKEIGFMLPMVLVGFELIRAKSFPIKKNNALIAAGLFGLAAVIYMALRAMALNAPLGGELARDRWENMATQINSWLLYIKLFVWPTEQAFIRPYPVISVGEAIPGVMLVVGMAGGVVYGFRKIPALGIGAAIFVAALLPVTLVPLNVIVSEERGYLAWTGLALIMALPLETMLKNQKIRHMALPAIVVSICTLAVLTLQQNARWKGVDGLFRHSAGLFVADSYLLSKPERESIAKSINILGGYLKAKGNFSAAEAAMTKAIMVDDTYYEAYNNLGSLALRENDLSRAKWYFEKAVELYPDYPLGHFNLGIVAEKSFDLNTARQEYEKALKLRLFFPEAHTNLGLLLIKYFRDRESLEAAALHLKISLEQDPEQPGANQIRSLLGNYGSVRKPVNNEVNP